MTEGEAQAALAGVALELVAIADRLQQIHDALPASRNRDAMLEHRIPRDVATEVCGVVETVLVDEVRPVIRVPRGGVAGDGGGAARTVRARPEEPMTPETMPEPEGSEDERFVYVLTAAGVEALPSAAVKRFSPLRRVSGAVDATP